MCDTCDDSRFELIKKYKQKLLDATNIEDSPEEMVVIDNILFRFWQMRWLDRLELFGNSEQLDTISRATAIETVRKAKSIGQAHRMLVQLPPVQPPKEIPKRVLWTGWKGYRDTRYKCPNCEKPVRNDDTYCHRCGQRLMFPHISFTDYVPGQKQDVIVRWADE